MNGNRVTIATLGSHSALDICKGAKDEGFHTLVICQKSREKTYNYYYKSIVDEVLLLNSFDEILKAETQEFLQKKNCILIPHRSLLAYLNFDYEAIEQKLKIPLFGNRYLLKYEERSNVHNQYDLMNKAGIRIPKIFKSQTEIDRLCMVKIPEKKRAFERAFFFCSTTEEFNEIIQKKIKADEIDENGINKAVIEEFIIGPYINFNYFYSPLQQRLELLGTDTRRQTNIDGFLHLMASQQLLLSNFSPKFEEAGHIAVTIVESMLEQIFELGEKLISETKKRNLSIVGPFALQSAIIPGPPKKDIVVFDLSLRIPGSPGIMFTPYSYYLHGFQVSAGRRIAMEIKQAVKEDRMKEIVT